MKKILHRAADRGIQDHGWLKAAHSFSFAGYHNPSRMSFGVLRVLNDDIIAPGKGFGTHSHNNMEIVTIPLRGELAHKDSLGSVGNIKHGEVQVMSAGKVISHSEFNGSSTEEVNLLQIWVMPKEIDIEPRYDQRAFDDVSDAFKTVVSPHASDSSMWINQDAFFSLGNFSKLQTASYKIKHPGNGAYVFLIEGEVEIDGQTLHSRDALGIYDTEGFELMFTSDSKILIVDVPMQ